MFYGKQELKNVVAGAALLGAGGGGSPLQGYKLVNEVINAGKKVEVRPPKNVPDDGFVASIYGMGAPSASRLGYRNEHLRAHEMYNERFPRKIGFVVPFEIGAGNSAVPLHSGAFMGVPVVDGDGAGRAVPELQLTTFDIYGVHISPMSIAGASGEGGMLYVETAEAAESIGRAITHYFNDMAGCVSYPMDGATLKKVVVPNTLSLCERTGGIIHRLRPSGEAISNELQKKMGMVELGRGLVTKKETEARGGFDYGYVEVKGKKDNLKVLFKNENIIALRNNRIVAMMPDLVCWISEGGDPLTNADVKRGQRLIALGMGANELVRSPKALAAFSHLYKEQGRKESFKRMEKL